MSKADATLLRFLARDIGRAIPIRQTSTIADDVEGAIGIATIKIVTEEQIQAIAYGDLDRPPKIIARIDPLSRDVTDLAAFAEFLDEVANRAIETNSGMRVWVPHSGTIEALDVLGHRYWRNTTAPPEIVRMGAICRIIANEAAFPGQQVVANAADILRSHVVTGQAPIEDGHLDALLAWVDPTVLNPLAEARARIRVPASGVLTNTPDCRDDDMVDRLRKDAKTKTGLARDASCKQIWRILSEAVVREWNLMVSARKAFLALGMSTNGLEALVAHSHDRFMNALTHGHYPPRRPHRISMFMDDMESSEQLAAQVALESDIEVRRAAARVGSAVVGSVTAVHQRRRGFKPCFIDVDTDQTVVRSRADDKVKIVGSNVKGVIRSITAVGTQRTRLHIEITDGVRSYSVISVGSVVEIIDQGFVYVRVRELNAASINAPWMFYSDATPQLPSSQPAQSPVAIANARRATP